MTVDGDVFGTCGDFIAGADLLACACACDLDPDSPANQVAANEAVTEASQLLYILSGRTIRGQCTRTVLPEMNGSCSCSPQTTGICERSRIPLEWPVVSVDEVKIDGVVVAASEYHVEDYRWLVRLRDSSGARRHWPSSPLLDTAANAEGSFSVTYTYGLSLPSWAEDAAMELACHLIRACTSQTNGLPEGVTGVSRQGVTWTVETRAQALKDGMTPDAFPAVLRFLSMVNPQQQQMPTFAYSGDVARLRRVTS